MSLFGEVDRVWDLKQLFDLNSAARAREDVEKLDTRARKKMMRLRHMAMVGYWLLFTNSSGQHWFFMWMLSGATYEYLALIAHVSLKFFRHGWWQTGGIFWAGVFGECIYGAEQCSGGALERWGSGCKTIYCQHSPSLASSGTFSDVYAPVNCFCY